jgi:hypothetical protein
MFNNVKVTKKDIKETRSVKIKDNIITEFMSDKLRSAWINIVVLNKLALSKVIISVKSSFIIIVNSFIVIK